MSRKLHVLIAGTGPVPQEGLSAAFGPTIRVRQFIEPVLDDGHDISLLLFENQRRVPQIEGIRQAAALPPNEVENPAVVRTILETKNIDAVVGVGSLLPVHAAANLAATLDKPLWVDFFGDPLAEQHALRTRTGGELPFRDHVHRLTLQALLAGDAFSTVSEPQRNALLGQLLLLGRCENTPHALQHLHVVPCGVPKSWTESAGDFPWPSDLCDHGLKEGDPYIYFGGTWNVWMDEVAMAAAIRSVLSDYEDAWLVCRGIGSDQTSQSIRKRMLDGLEPVKERIAVLDAQTNEAPLLTHARACICLDRDIPEAVLGSRNRLLAMVRHGAMPVISALGELECELVAQNLAVRSDNPATALASVFRRNDEQRKTDAARGREWLGQVSFKSTMTPLLRWLEQHAPGWPMTSQSEGLIDQWAKLPWDQLPHERKKRWGLF